MPETRARFLSNLIGATSTDNDFTLPDTAVSGTDKKVLTSGGDGTVTWETTLSAPTITSVTTPASDNSINEDDNVVMTVTGENFADAGMTAKLVDASDETSVVTGHDTSDLSINYTNSASISVTTRASTANISQSNVKLVITKSGLSATSASIGVSPDPTFTSLSNPHATLLDNLEDGVNVGSAISASASDGASITYSISGTTSNGNTYIINATSGQITTPSAGIADVASGSTSYSESPTVTATAGGDSTRTETISVPLVINKFVPQLFSGKTYNGTGSSNSITFDETNDFQPDLVWIKARNQTLDHVSIDSVVNERLHPNLNNSSASYSSFVSFDSDGFTVTNNSGVNQNSPATSFIAWAWKAGGAPTVDNSGGQTPTSGSKIIDGSISTANFASANIYPKRQSINTNGDFSITKYVGTSTSTNQELTVPHGLSGTPDFVIIKNLDSAVSWTVWTPNITSGYLIRLDVSTGEDNPGTGIVASASSTTVTTKSTGTNGNNVNQNNVNYIMYAWKAVSGLSAFGTYAGTGTNGFTSNGNGGVNDMEFKPRFLIIKRITSSGSWTMWDTFRTPAGDDMAYLYTNGDSDEQAGSNTFTPTLYDDGFRYDANVSHASLNGSSDNYIYMAFA